MVLEFFQAPRANLSRPAAVQECKARGQRIGVALRFAASAPTPLECDGIARDPPKVADQVRLLARAIASPRVCRMHVGVRSRKAGSDSRAGDRPYGRHCVLGVCRIRTRPCEGRRPGSIPGEDIGHQGRWSQTARRPAATRLKWVRLPPASLDPLSPKGHNRHPASTVRGGQAGDETARSSRRSPCRTWASIGLNSRATHFTAKGCGLPHEGFAVTIFQASDCSRSSVSAVHDRAENRGPARYKWVGSAE